MHVRLGNLDKVQLDQRVQLDVARFGFLFQMGALFDSLTDRERQVLAEVVRGRLNKNIADLLGIHERTVKLHRTSITAKLGVRSVAEMTRLTQEAGLLPDAAPAARGPAALT